MDYYELQTSKSKENLKEIIRIINVMQNSMEELSRLRYEMLIKLLLDKRIIDTEKEINELVEHEYQEPAKEILNRLPNYSDVNDGKISGTKNFFKNNTKQMTTLLESEIESILDRTEELEHRTSITKTEEE